MNHPQTGDVTEEQARELLFSQTRSSSRIRNVFSFQDVGIEVVG